MADVVDKATRSRMMAGIRPGDTRPELFLRKSLHGMGFRYRLGGRGLPGKPDLVFPSRGVAVFVHGCFWHKHNCAYFKWPTNNAAFWRQKLEANAARDASVSRMIRKAGWASLVVWECELRLTKFRLPNRAVSRVARALTKIR